MTDDKDNWLKEACYKIALLEAMKDIFIVPDARTLKAFLKRPTLIIKMAYRDKSSMYQEILNDYTNFQQNKDAIITNKENLKLLNDSYEKGLTPDEAAVEIIKWCDTPKEAGKYITSPNLMPILFFTGLITILIATAIMMYNITVDKVNVQNEYENSSSLYKNVNNLYKNKGDFKLDTAIAIKEGIVPKNMTIVSDKVMNRWEGEVNIIGTSLNNFEVKYSHVKAHDVCIDLLMIEKKIGWSSVLINEQKFDNYEKMKMTDIVTSCDRKDFVDITFKK